MDHDMLSLTPQRSLEGSETATTNEIMHGIKRHRKKSERKRKKHPDADSAGTEDIKHTDANLGQRMGPGNTVTQHDVATHPLVNARILSHKSQLEPANTEGFDLLSLLLGSSSCKRTLTCFSKRLDIIQDQINIFEGLKTMTEKRIKTFSGEEAEYEQMLKRMAAYDNVIELTTTHSTDVFVHQQALWDVIEETEFEAADEVKAELKKARKGLKHLMKTFEEKYSSELNDIHPASDNEASSNN